MPITSLAASDSCKVAWEIFDQVNDYIGKVGGARANDGKNISHLKVDSKMFDTWYMTKYDEWQHEFLGKYQYLADENIKDDSDIGLALNAFMQSIDVIQFYKNYIDLLNDKDFAPNAIMIFPERVISAKEAIDENYRKLATLCQKNNILICAYMGSWSEIRIMFSKIPGHERLRATSLNNAMSRRVM